MQNRFALALASLGLLALSSTANAELIYGITGAAAGTNLVSFDSAIPGTVTTIGALTGVLAGQSIRAIDFRPADGKLYAVGNTGTTGASQLYTVNLLSGALTPVGSGFTFTGNNSTRFGIDFNPRVDLLRVVTGSGQNLRVNANSGALVGQDTSLDPNLLIGDVAYDNNVVGATQTTLYAYDYITDRLGTIGGINGSPSPNGGTFNVIGGAGGPSAFAANLGFDISGTTGVGYISFDDGPSPTVATEFYTVNLGTGALSLVGTTGSTVLLDFSVFIPAPVAVPEPGTVALLVGMGISGVALRRRRK